MTSARRTVASALALLGLSTVFLTGCGTDTETLRLSASATPHAEILQFVQESGQLQDTKLEIETISGQVDPNQLLVSGDVDANYYQHKPYLDDWQRQNSTDDLVIVAATHIEPMALYSTKVADVAAIPTGATIALPKDPTNFARALYVLQGAGLLTMARPADEANLSTITANDVADNPRQLQFVGLDAAQLPRTLDDPQVTASVINSNYAIEAGLNPAQDGLVAESATDNPYANILVTTADRADDPGIRELKAALESEQTAEWIAQQYGDSVVPVHAAR